MKIGIIGLGLMGGSLGLALKEKRIASMIAGSDINEFHRRQALYLGLVDECLDMEEIIQCDVVFICTPVNAIVDIIKNIKSLKANQTIIDFGGTKREIIKAIPKKLRKNFISLHPMCGTENFGPKAAFKDLYKNQIMIFVDIINSGEYQIDLAKNICIQLEMNIIKMDSKSHDRHTAFISHMPHILSYALANMVLKQENPQDIVSIAGGGFKSMSRISKSSGVMWSAVAKQNKSEILKSIELFEDELNIAKTLIQKDDFEKLREWMNNANKLREII
ncbi:prephenate dehydrogenase [Helicobacter sp. MIT 14-3879]|uniref:prephenate dehydrogenase n=1 Tax=Helicobacter sp. MIT 14-3879 TaxID=2040649 RepID=UPI000E1E782C|nr:prephenate dehydrogenase [Helicobacter sp. MIT 14-3879]RDU64685.1 prephenate dehydrogenase [Helicobacter sp. MIT 14-3879]